MPGFKMTYCPKCRNATAHDIYISSGGYIHSLCADCGKDAESSAKVDSHNGEAVKSCSRCKITTEHIRYISPEGYIHWFCCSCGKDIDSAAKEA